MKKTFTVLLIMIILIFALSGCASSPESTLQSKWSDHYEKYTYDVTKDLTSVGNLVYEIERFKNTDVAIGGVTHSNLNGTKISYKVTIGTDTVEAEVFLTTLFESLYSYKKIVKDGVETIIDAKYEDMKYKYTVNGEAKEDISVKKALFYDNEAVYQIIRCATISISFTFSVPSPFENKLQSRTVTKMADADITAMGGTIKCNQYSMGVNEKITGSSYNLYYAVNPVSLPSENVSVVLPLVKFIEGEYSYTMTSVTTVKAV